MSTAAGCLPVIAEKLDVNPLVAALLATLSGVGLVVGGLDSIMRLVTFDETVTFTAAAEPLAPELCEPSSSGDGLTLVQADVECLASLYEAGDRAGAEDRFGGTATALWDDVAPTGSLTSVDCYPNNICALRWTDTCATVQWSTGEQLLGQLFIGCSSGGD